MSAVPGLRHVLVADDEPYIGRIIKLKLEQGPFRVTMAQDGREALEVLDREGIAIAGRHAVVVGRSGIVGKPMSLLLLHRDATVTICHSKTADLGAVTSQADILVSAVGRPGFLTARMVKPGAAVVDVGTTPISDRALAARIFGEDSPRLATLAARGAIVVGDAHPSVGDVAGALSPVPGGVGPLTIAMLLKNTLTAAERRASS